MRTPTTLTLLASLLLASPALAGEKLLEPSSELKFDKTPSIDGKPYLCLGTGIRKKAVFRVYALVFCVEEAAGKAELEAWFAGAGKKHASLTGEDLAEALAEDPAFYKLLVTMKADKAADLVFLRDLEAAKMKESFTESLTRSLGVGEKARIDSFVNLLDRDIKENDRLTLRTRPSGDIAVGIGEPKKLTDEKLARAVWDAYFGPAGASPALKESVAEGVAALRK